MEIRTTERTECNKNVAESEGVKPSKWQVLKEWSITLLKKGLVYLLLRPATWQFIMVHVPKWIDKAEIFVRNALAYLGDLF